MICQRLLAAFASAAIGRSVSGWRRTELIGLAVLRHQFAIPALQVDLEQRALVASARVNEKDGPPIGRVRDELGRLAVLERDFSEARPRAVALAFHDLGRTVTMDSLAEAQREVPVGVKTVELAVLEHQG